MNKAAVFNPSIAEATAIAEKYRGLTIKNVDDKEGYKAVYDAQQELKNLRVDITKFGKKEREEALAWQREVLRQEKELLKIITPVEDELKAERERIDEEKKKAERLVLLPSRKKMLEEIGDAMNDDEILALDEKEFSELFNAKKLAYLEAKEAQLNAEREKLDQEKREAEEAKQRVEELEKAKEEAATRAKEDAEKKAKDELEQMEKKKQAEIDKIREEQAEKERLEQEKVAKEQEEKEKAEKNRRYKAWLKKNGVTNTNVGNFHIERIADNENGTTFKIYEYKDLITIK